MKTRLLIIMYFFVAAMPFSCNTKFFVKEKNVLYKSAGFLIFWDKKNLPTYSEQDHLIPDSLIGDIFISTKFNHVPLNRNELGKLFLEKKIDEGHFLHLVNDNHDYLRNQSIAAGIAMHLDQTVDSYLKSKDIFIVPVVLTFSKVNNFKSYYFENVSKIINLKYSGESKIINLQIGYYNVIDIDVWPNK